MRFIGDIDVQNTKIRRQTPTQYSNQRKNFFLFLNTKPETCSPHKKIKLDCNSSKQDWKILDQIYLKIGP